jgi:hypothetical protein
MKKKILSVALATIALAAVRPAEAQQGKDLPDRCSRAVWES